MIVVVEVNWSMILDRLAGMVGATELDVLMNAIEVVGMDELVKVEKLMGMNRLKEVERLDRVVRSIEVFWMIEVDRLVKFITTMEVDRLMKIDGMVEVDRLLDADIEELGSGADSFNTSWSAVSCCCYCCENRLSVSLCKEGGTEDCNIGHNFSSKINCRHCILRTCVSYTDKNGCRSV